MSLKILRPAHGKLDCLLPLDLGYDPRLHGSLFLGLHLHQNAARDLAVLL